ncbi:MAG: hypothetical protein ACXWDN_03825 [Limisphaerales bacterium]
MESILSSIVWRFLRWLPPIILRKFFSKEWLAKHIYIDIRPRHTSVEIIQPDSPSVRIYLDIKNNTHFQIVIDRLVVKFIYGTEMATLYHFKREAYKPGEDRWLYLQGNIEHNQFKLLPFQYQHNSRDCRLQLLVEVNSKFHNFSIEKSLEGIKPEIMNSHLLTAANKSSNLTGAENAHTS